MQKRKKGGKFRRLPPHKKLSDAGKRLTASARKLYNRIYTFGVAGCWMSNDTLADQMDYCTKTIKRARKLLFERGDIIVVRTLPRTWSCWAKTHPAVKKKAILYFKGGYIDNPFFEEPEPKSVGGHFVPSEGTKCPLSRKNRGALTGSIPKGAPDKGSPLPADTKPTSEGGPSDPPQQSATPQDLTISPTVTENALRSPAVQKNNEQDIELKRQFEKLRKERVTNPKKYQQKKYFPT